MRCTSPRSVGFKADGKTLSWSPRTNSKEYATFQLPCGKCIECRLDYARQWAIRCVHEAQMYENNIFLTLTYSDENLTSPRLIYEDFQLFMKKLRKLQNEAIGMFVTGEYGEKTKRPHWHAIIFNYAPKDCEYIRSNERGDRIYTSKCIDRVWGKGMAEIGSVTFESAGYCARYAAKKLVHGKDGHEYQPISKKSSKHAIGKAWLEEFWPDVFSYGRCILHDGTETGIPRYYEKWFQQKMPHLWRNYVTGKKSEIITQAQFKAAKEKLEWETYRNERRNRNQLAPNPLTKDQVRQKIQEQKFLQLQQYLKLK